jgi:NAD(P)-dependent dehydrogenase (short-subunit alcohol dehydrogenase family)
MDQITPSLL